MKIAIVGAGAMGSLFGSLLARANDVTLIDVFAPTVDAVNTNGLHVADKDGNVQAHRLRAVSRPADAGSAELVIVFVKCYHTEQAARDLLPLLGEQTAVLSLQNGWGNAPKLASIVGADRVLAGVTYHSATVTAPGAIQHAGRGKTIIGELDGRDSARVQQIAQAFRDADIEVETTREIRKEIWSKLALNVCTLPTAALLKFTAGELGKHTGTVALLQELLRECVNVAQAQGIDITYDERWSAISGVLERAVNARPSMLQDVEARRKTEIDVINGAIVEGGARLNVPTPYNQAMVWMVQALQETF